MNAAELKLKIFRQIDSLENSKLEELYGVLINYLNGKVDTDDWKRMTDNQRQGILDALDEIDTGKGVPHLNVIAKYRDKYSNA
jgi:hypothetical protein